MTIRQRARAIVRRFGFDVVRYDPLAGVPLLAPALRRRACLLSTFGIDLVLDVGANTGQFGRELRALGYRGRIVSFEPLSSAFSVLARAARADGRWEALHMALGDANGTAEMHIAANSVSSSLLPMLPAHLAAAPNSGYVGSEPTPVRRLDSLFDRICSPAERVFLKVDAQGYERRILEGAPLERIQTLQLEMSLIPLYEGEWLFRELYELLEEKGYTLVFIEPAFADERTGQVLQIDGIFHREER